jgi:4-diphosphocytidyl-2-C-methyl-D-erythritol kinase
MPTNIIEHAPAKVNLALHVTGQRADGYHLLDTLVVFTRAGDRIRIRPAERDSFSIEGPYAHALAGDGDNLVTRARDAVRERHGRHDPVEIVLEKYLPIASGIGGGSSDAAATVRGLSRLWNLPSQDREIAVSMLALGADMPMCLAARTLRAQGVGEMLTPVASFPEVGMVLANPGVAVPTPTIFRALADRCNPPLPALPHAPDFSALVDWLEGTRNDLEGAARSIAPEIDATFGALREAGAVFARMSGSGATCFGLFASPAEAEAAAQTIAASQPAWYVKATTTLESAVADVPH